MFNIMPSLLDRPWAARLTFKEWYGMINNFKKPIEQHMRDQRSLYNDSYLYIIKDICRFNIQKRF